MTGGRWINLLYEVMNERGLLDSKVELAEMNELLNWAEDEEAHEIREFGENPIVSQTVIARDC